MNRKPLLELYMYVGRITLTHSTTFYVHFYKHWLSRGMERNIELKEGWHVILIINGATLTYVITNYECHVVIVDAKMPEPGESA